MAARGALGRRRDRDVLGHRPRPLARPRRRAPGVRDLPRDGDRGAERGSPPRWRRATTCSRSPSCTAAGAARSARRPSAIACSAPAPRPGAGGLPRDDRLAEAGRADLEARGLPRRRRVDRAGLVSDLLVLVPEHGEPVALSARGVGGDGRLPGRPRGVPRVAARGVAARARRRRLRPAGDAHGGPRRPRGRRPRHRPGRPRRPVAAGHVLPRQRRLPGRRPRGDAGAGAAPGPGRGAALSGAAARPGRAARAARLACPRPARAGAVRGGADLRGQVDREAQDPARRAAEDRVPEGGAARRHQPLVLRPVLGLADRGAG